MAAPKLRFKEFDQIWDNLKYKDVLTIKYGKDHKLLNEGEFPVYGTGGVMRYADQYLHDGESILIGRKGTIDQPKYVNEKFWTVDTLFYTQIKDNSIPLFLYQHALQVNWLGLNEATGVPSLNTTSINNVDIALPSKEEQTKIATFLSAVDEKISQLTQKHALLSQYKQGMMQKLFSQQIRFKADDGSEFGEWEETELGKHCQIKTGKLDANAMRPNGEFRFYTCAKEFYLIDEYAFDTEALLISGNGANVGYIHYYKGKFNAYQRTYVLDQWQQNIIFIQYFLEQFLKERIYGEKKEGNTPYIVLSTLSEMPLLLPCLAEQTKIANFLSAIDQKIEVVAQQIEQAKLWKKGLLQQMFV
jgi:type I restriction enzyme S subunit